MTFSVLRRVLVENKSQLPPTFLLPWAARLTTLAQTTDRSSVVNSLPSDSQATRHGAQKSSRSPTSGSLSQPNPPAAQDSQTVQQSATELAPAASVSESIRELLPLLRSQAPHYITVHVHGKPYLVTQGDTVRLPFMMHGVHPGDTIRLNRAVNLGSRDYTLKAPAPPSRTRLAIAEREAQGLSNPSISAPHFIPHIAKDKIPYLDERLFTCRAVVMGVESEPLRIKEKTKRRQRHVRHIKSKHSYTILKISELRVNELQE